MKIIRYLALALGLFALAGCGSTPEQRARYAQEQQDRAYQAQMERQRNQERWADGLKEQCRSYGFREGTTEFSQCLMQTDQQKRAANAAAFAEQDRQREQLFQTARDLAKPPAFAPVPCNSGVMRNGRCVNN